MALFKYFLESYSVTTKQMRKEIQFSRLLLDILSRSKDIIIPYFLIHFTRQIEVSLLIVLNILALHLFDFE